MVNKVILIGALGSDPEVKTTRADESMARMRVATNRRVQRDGRCKTFRKSCVGGFCGKKIKQGGGYDAG